MGLWGTLLVWEFTSGEFLGFRRESASPHGCQGSPVCTGGAEVLGKEAPRDGGPVAPLPGPLEGGHSLGTLAEPPWVAFWHLGLSFCSQNEGAGLACRLHSSPPGGYGRHLLLPLELRTERCNTGMAARGCRGAGGDCWWEPGFLWDDEKTPLGGLKWQ